MKNLEHIGSITFAEERIERNSREIFRKPIKVKWEGFLASSFQEISATSVWLPMLSNPLLLSQDFIPEKYKGIFTVEGELKSQYTAFAQYFESFIQGISFFKYFRSQIEQKTRDASKTLSKKYTSAVFHWLEEELGFCIAYGMGRSKKGLLEITQEYIAFLKGSGSQGTKFAKFMQKLSQEEEEALWGIWEDATPPMWLSLLYKSFIEDHFDKKKKRAEMPPALTRETVDKGLKRLLQENNPIISINDRDLEYFSKGDRRSIGCIPIKSKNLPNVQPDIIPIIRAGGELVGSFMAHKLLHYENKLFYDRWNNNEKDFRKISIDGGYAELARKLGYTKGGKNIEKLKKILYFQAAFWFTLPSPDGGSKTGNLISLTEHKNKFGEIGKLDIIAGSMLTPEAVYTASKEDGGNLLIPFVELPEKMLGNPATWGGQAFLQMLILEYITMNSREFAGKESVRITKEQWETLILEAKLPTTFVQRVKDIQKLFCCPEQGFLDMQGEEYAFNKKNKRAAKHLVAQGQRREKRSKQAKRAHIKKK